MDCQLSIIILGPRECQDGVTHNCTQLCTRNQTDSQMHYICSCEEGYKLNKTSDGSCIGECIIYERREFASMCMELNLCQKYSYP